MVLLKLVEGLNAAEWYCYNHAAALNLLLRKNLLNAAEWYYYNHAAALNLLLRERVPGTTDYYRAPARDPQGRGL